MTSNPHDALFKKAFAVPENAAGEFRAVLPAPLIAQLDLSTLTVEPGSFVDEALRARQTDLLYSVQLHGHSAFLYLLFEHQSSVDPLMPYRLLRYMCRIWENLIDEDPTRRALPPIVPVVLHHSETGWTAARTFTGLFDLEPETLAAVEPYVPRFEFILDDLSGQTEAQLYARAMTAYARLVLWSLRTSRAGPDPAMLTKWALVFAEMARATEGRQALAVVLRYLMEASSDESVVDAILAAPVGDEARETIVTLRERYIEQGMKQGLHKAQDILLKQLRLRFGELPAATIERVRAASPDDLDRWAERVLTAPTLDDALR